MFGCCYCYGSSSNSMNKHINIYCFVDRFIWEFLFPFATYLVITRMPIDDDATSFIRLLIRVLNLWYSRLFSQHKECLSLPMCKSAIDAVSHTTRQSESYHWMIPIVVVFLFLVASGMSFGRLMHQLFGKVVCFFFFIYDGIQNWWSMEAEKKTDMSCVNATSILNTRMMSTGFMVTTHSSQEKATRSEFKIDFRSSHCNHIV